MKHESLIIILLLFLSCSNQKKAPETSQPVPEIKQSSKEVERKDMQTVLDSAELKGAVLVYDLQEDIYFANNFDWIKKGQLPASTFKIANSMIALETGVVKNLETNFKWDGQKRHFKIWEKDMSFKQAFKVSCFPCYREIAKKVGVDRMNEWLVKLDYGKPLKVDTSSLDLFWVAGDWEVTPLDQIDFLLRLYHSQLPISQRTENIVKDLMINERNEQFVLREKTGWSFKEADNNGWFVGYLETKGKVFFFATNVEPDASFDMKKFPAIRKHVTMQVLKRLKII